VKMYVRMATLGPGLFVSEEELSYIKR